MKRPVIKIPDYVLKVMTRLNVAGFEAFVVGGCIRDFLRGVEPVDWDICTSATPKLVEQTFSDFLPVIPTGEKYGTVTVLSDKKPIEVTTYRADSSYIDNRRPNSVRYLRTIDGDLSRRDFTVNAMAYNEKCGLIDKFGGAEDLKRGILRCVGDPRRRFTEDALRIMRALRFSAVCGFEIETGTSSALSELAYLLKSIAAERIYAELKKLLCADSPSKVLIKYRDVFELLMPRAFCPANFNKAYCNAVDLLTKSIPLRLSAILCSAESAEITQILINMKCDSKTHKSVCATSAAAKELLGHLPADRYYIKRFLNKTGVENTRRSIELAAAITTAQGNTADALFTAAQTLQDILKNGECFSIADLDINGSDLLALGAENGKNIGIIMQNLLDGVMRGEVENSYAALADLSKSYITQ